jgi:glycerate dehydrogenase
MRIVVLDGYTLNPGDLSWDALYALGHCRIYDRSEPDEIVPRASGAEVVLINKTELSRDALSALPGLRYVGVLATGYNVIDVRAAAELGIAVTNVPAYGTASVAQMVFAHLLNLTQRVAHHAQTTVDGRWSECPDFCYWDFPLVELSGLTMGIVGFGRIGQQVAHIARAFGMRVLAHDVGPISAESGAQAADLDTLFRESDVISLHCPLTDENRRMVDRRRLGLMKPTALLINTSRGPLIDEDALADALSAGRIAGAGLDVLAVEPPVADNRLFFAPNCFVTPHIAWATRAARARLLDVAVANIRAFLAGVPQNVVNGVGIMPAAE